MFERGRVPLMLLLILLIVPLSPMAPEASVIADSTDAHASTSGRALTTWSGSVSVTSDYTVTTSNELRILACTNVSLSGGVRILIEGRLTVEGTESCPVVVSRAGVLDHEGFQFNSTSTGRGSLIRNLTIRDAQYGITMFGGDAIIENLTVERPDLVAVDLFSGAQPVIRDLRVNGAGVDVIGSTSWRHGIGLSIGSGAAPLVERATFQNLTLRAVNVWGGSGGVLRGLSIANVTGATMAQAAGIWVEDSSLLFEDVNLTRCETGIIIRHITEGGLTRAVMRRVIVEDSQYRGVLVDKEDRSNISNYQTALFSNLTIRGTAGSNAITPGLGEAAMEINASGAYVEDLQIESNDAVGLRLFRVDSSTVIRRAQLDSNGQMGDAASSAGISIQSSYFAARLENMTVMDSVGDGIHARSGGAAQGADWNLSGNGGDGMEVDGATFIVERIEAHGNGHAGVHIREGRNVVLSEVNTSHNGHLGTSGSTGAGLVFHRSNDLETVSGDVRCTRCTSIRDGWGGVHAIDSVDLWLIDLEVRRPGNGTSAIDIDNGGLDIGQQGGLVRLHGARIEVETSAPAVDLLATAASIQEMELLGNHSGIRWDADHHGTWTSRLEDSTLSGSGCLLLLNHTDLMARNLTLGPGCEGTMELRDSMANMSGLVDATGDHALIVDGSSELHLHQPVGVNLSNATIGGGALVDEAWDLQVTVRNQFANGIPYAFVEASFSQLEPTLSERTNEDGRLLLEDFIGRRWTSSGPGVVTQVNLTCRYDGNSSLMTVDLDGDRTEVCDLHLSNQAPFVSWLEPEDEVVLPSGSTVRFDASASWDLEDEPLSYTWTSSIDGDLASGCSIQVPNGSILVVNGVASPCPMTDGVHDVTLQVCDPGNRCVNETRRITLTNLPPSLDLRTDPTPNEEGVLLLPRTHVLMVDASRTSDPEGDELTTTWSVQGATGVDLPSACVTDCPLTWNLSFVEAVIDGGDERFILRLEIGDGVNQARVWTVVVEMVNELPSSVFTVHRSNATSTATVHLDGNASVDPEGDGLIVEWVSDLEGTLSTGTGTGALHWNGTLSRGIHQITLRVSDDRPEHLGIWNTSSTLVIVENSPPTTIIDLRNATNPDSSDLITFTAAGSGDVDASCDDFLSGFDWICSTGLRNSSTQFLTVTWTSSIDGPLTPSEVDLLVFERRLTAGDHRIELTIDDGLASPVTRAIDLRVEPSAPDLRLASPLEGDAINSDPGHLLDARGTIDHDGDVVTLRVRSSMDAGTTWSTISDQLDPARTSRLALGAGEHMLEIQAIDDTGRARSVFVNVTVLESDPVAIVEEPSPFAYIPPGDSATLISASTDADDDLDRTEWRRWVNGTYEVLARTSEASVRLPPGVQHLSLWVGDARGGNDEVHFDVTVGSTPPDLDVASFLVGPNPLIPDRLQTLSASIRLDDADGSTQNLTLEVIFDDQRWSMAMSDEDGDGVWEANLSLRPEGEGRALVRVTAVDGDGAEAQTDVATIPIDVGGSSETTSSRLIPIGIGGIVVALALGLALTLARARRIEREMELIEGWQVSSDVP